MSSSLTAETLAAYARWAPIYPPVAHNPLMRAEQRAMLAAMPPLIGRRALDLACGTGRYAQLLCDAGAAAVTAVDFSLPMLRRTSRAMRICASMMNLPFADDTYDVVVSGLAVGHATTLDGWMAEVSRVLSRGGRLVYSDFHPEATRAGLTRSFKDESDRSVTVPHRCYEVSSQREAAAAAGLTIDLVHEIRVGEELLEEFPRSGDFYTRWQGLPIVLVIRVRK